MTVNLSGIQAVRKLTDRTYVLIPNFITQTVIMETMVTMDNSIYVIIIANWTNSIDDKAIR